MSTSVKFEILNMSIIGRIQLVAKIWDTIAAVPDEVELTNEYLQGVPQ